MRRVPIHLTANARELRNNATNAERTIWRLLSRSRPRFTRQLVVADYIVDLACRQARLAVEFDGSQHLDRTVYDADRTRALEALGWMVVRYWNGEVSANPAGVASDILRHVAERLGDTHPRPLPSREERKRR